MKKIGKKGQTLVEYVLIISVIAIIAISLVKSFGGYLKDAVTKSSCALANKEYIEAKKAGEGYCDGDNKPNDFFE